MQIVNFIMNLFSKQQWWKVHPSKNIEDNEALKKCRQNED